MRNKPVLTATEVAALIPDDAVVSVSSSSALGCPDFVLQGIGEAFERTGSPRNLTTVHPIAAVQSFYPMVEALARARALGLLG